MIFSEIDIRKYYRCGMISLIFIPIMFYFSLKTNKAFNPQYGISNKYLNESDSCKLINDDFYWYYSDYSHVNKTDTITITSPINKTIIDNSLILKSGHSLLVKFSDDLNYGDYILFYNSALKRHLDVYNINNSSIKIFVPIDKKLTQKKSNFDFDEPFIDFVYPKQSRFKRFVSLVQHRFMICKFYINFLMDIGIFYKVLIIIVSYLIITILNILELKRLLTWAHTPLGFK